MRTIHANKMRDDLMHGSRRLALALEGNGRQSSDEDKTYIFCIYFGAREGTAYRGGRGQYCETVKHARGEPTCRTSGCAVRPR